jgi:2-iminobutanoate/2-iminopropanoate deaminase
MNAVREMIVGSPGARWPFSKVVGCGPWVFVSGSIGRDPRTGEIAKGDMYAQTAQTLANIDALLKQAGLTPERVLKATVFVTDMGALAAMNRAYSDFFKNGFPARSCVGVSALPDPDALVEIEVVACR